MRWVLSLAGWLLCPAMVLAQTLPVITSQPSNQLAVIDGTATLSVSVSGSEPFSYQWYFDGALAEINGTITTVTGLGVGDGGSALNASLNVPSSVAVDAAGDIFIADELHDRIRKVGTNGVITTVAGTGGTGGFSGDGGPATNAAILFPVGVALDTTGNLFIVDQGNSRIRKVATNGIISTVAGNGVTNFSGDGGPATNAALNNPQGVALDAAGNIFIADSYNNRVRKVGTNGIITTVAGIGPIGLDTGTYSGDGGAATNASLDNPQSVALDAAGNLFIADLGNVRIRKVGTNGIITTVAGNGTGGYTGDGSAATNAQLSSPLAVALDTAGNLFIADVGVNVVRKVGTNGIINTVAGNGSPNYSGDGAPATNAALNYPSGINADAKGNLFIADQGNYLIRKVTTNGIINSVAGDGAILYAGDGNLAANAAIWSPNDVSIDSAGNILIADTSNNRIRKIGTNGVITTVAGDGPSNYNPGGYSGDGGPATNAALSFPAAIVADAAGNLFIADTDNSVIRKVNTSGIISTVAGNGVSDYAGDGGPATNAELSYPEGVALDAIGNLFIADTENNVIRKVGTNGIITTVAGNGGNGNYTGDGGPATNASLYAPWDIVFDSEGELFISDSGNCVIRKVDIHGIISTVAGNGSTGYSGDGGPATNASFYNQDGLALDAAGNLYIADWGNNVVRVVGINGIINTLAGNGPSDGYESGGYSGDGGQATNASLNNPTGLAVDAAGNVFIADTVNNLIRKVNASNLSLSSSGASLVLSSLAAENAGSYFVVIDNTYGAATSSVAALYFQPWFSAVKLTNGAVNLTIQGTVSSNYIVSYATNLTAPVTWTPLTTNTLNSTGKATIVDTNTSKFHSKFYKVTPP